MATTYRTKDGIVLRNVPDGTPEDQIKARIAEIRAGNAAPQSKGPSRRGAVERPFVGEKMPAEQLADFGSKIKRGGELAMRGINNAGMGLLTIVPDAGVAARNLLTGSNYQLPSDMFSEWQDARVQAPQSFAESAFESGVNIAAGAAVPFGSAKQGVKAVAAPGAKEGFSGVMQPPVLNSAQRAAQRAVREQAGDTTTRNILAEKLRNYRPGVKDVKPTVAEVVKDMPEGSPLQSLQQQVSQIAGAKFGQPSVEFGRQLAGNQAAREAAKKTLGESHGAVRDSILQSVSDSALGMQLEKIAGGVAGKMQDPRVYANDFASRAYSTFMDDLGKIVKDDGSIDPAALDEIRKSFGPKLTALFEKEGWNVKDAAFAKATRSAQGLIDEAIESAGGSGYRDELARYSREIGGIQDDALRADEMYTALQPSSSSLQTLIGEQVHRNVGSSLLNPKVAALNLALRLKGNYVGPKAIGEISKLLRNPDDLSQILGQGNVQGATEALQRALMQYGRRAPGAIGASRE